MRLFINRNNNFSYKNSPCKPIEASLVNQNESSIFDFDDFRAISARESSIFFYALRCLPHGLTPKNITSIAKELRGGKKRRMFRGTRFACVRKGGKHRCQASPSSKSRMSPTMASFCLHMSSTTSRGDHIFGAGPPWRMFTLMASISLPTALRRYSTISVR